MDLIDFNDPKKCCQNRHFECIFSLYVQSPPGFKLTRKFELICLIPTNLYIQLRYMFHPIIHGILYIKYIV